jgi:hypothetical protein
MNQPIVRAATVGICLLAPAIAQESKALLHAPLVVLPVDSPPFQRLGDFDGDGDLDAVGSRVVNSGQVELVVWRNDQGAFTQVWQTLAGGSHPQATLPRSMALATGDLNGDGRAEFVTFAGNVVRRYDSQPGMSFQATTIATVPTNAHSFAITTGDFDGDGALDIAFASLTTTLTGTLHVLTGTGALLAAPIQLLAPPSQSWSPGPLRLATLELDGSPGLEIVLGHPASSSAHLYQIAAGQIVLRQTMTCQLNYIGSTPWLWMGGDLDGDGDGDVVVFRPELGTNGIPRYQVFRNTGQPLLVLEPPQIGGPAEYLVDIDGDGDLDGVCCGGGGPVTTVPKLDFGSTFELALNDGTGNFARAWAFPGAGSESMAGANDIDGDGDLDFVAGRCVFYGNGPWTEQPMPIAGGKDVTIVSRPVDVHDFDRDGDLDLFPFATSRGDGAMALSTVTSQIAPPGFAYAGSILVDVDGDGARDRVMRLLVTNPPPAQFQAMAWLRNNGGGHFTYGGPVGPAGMQIGGAFEYSRDPYWGADLDGDGDEEIIHAPSHQVYWNDNQWFTPAGPVPTSLGMEAVGDFDGDGLLDVIRSNGWFPGVAVDRGTGDRTQPFVLGWYGAVTAPFEPAAIAIGDLDDDGRLDFVRPDASGALMLFVNTTPPGSNLSFAVTTLPSIQTKVLPSSNPVGVRSTITIADFDGDGRNDIAVGRALGEPNVGILLRRTGWSSPPSIADYEVLRQTFVDGWAGDADGDGDPDLIGVHTTKNRRIEGPAAGSRLQFHNGTPGEAGAVPLLGAVGPFRVGIVEELRLTSVPGPTLAVLGISLGTLQQPDVPLPGLTLWLDPTTLIAGDWFIQQNGHGRAAASNRLEIYLPHGLQGLVFYAQAFVLDVAAPGFVTQSNLLVKRVGS